MRQRDVLWILDALERAGVACVIAGGWGVDALSGHQTRRHHDLDLVLLEFERDEPRARSALGLLGFQQTLHWQASTRWMPSRSVMDDGAGRCIDLVNLEAAQLAANLSHRHPRGGLSMDDRRSPLFDSGNIGGRTVACLSAEAQLVLHCRFDLGKHQKRDVRLLRHTLCLPTTDRPTTPRPWSGARGDRTGGTGIRLGHSTSTVNRNVADVNDTG